MKLPYSEKANVNDLIDKLIIFARHRGYETKKVGRDVLEIFKSEQWRLFMGLSSSLRIVTIVKQDRTDVEVSGYAKEFILKAAIAFIGLLFPFLLIPLTFLAIYGAYQQYQLMEAVKAEMNDYFNSF